MRLLLDFLPIALFFAAYKFQGIFVATAVLMAATAVQMGVIYALDRKLQTMHKITLALILVFGTLTLVLQDERFIKWKPTVLYAAQIIQHAAQRACGLFKAAAVQNAPFPIQELREHAGREAH